MARAFTFPDDLVEVIEDESWTDEQRGAIALAAMRVAQDGVMPERTGENAAWWLMLRMVHDRLVASADAIERGRRGGKGKAAAPIDESIEAKIRRIVKEEVLKNLKVDVHVWSDGGCNAHLEWGKKEFGNT